MLGTPSSADACSCTQLSPCEAYARAGVVFVGKATNIVEGPGGSQTVTFAVTETLKGQVAKSIVVTGGGMCGASFMRDQAYVVYTGAGANPGVSLCEGTDLVSNARDALAYARGAGKRTKGVLEGHVHVAQISGRRPRGGIEVRAGKAKTRTDQTGAYRFELAPGTYTLGVVDPETRLATDAKTAAVLADARSCARVDLPVVWNGRVRGRVIGVDGKPAAGVEVTLVGTKAADQRATTDAKGTYELTGTPAGEYTVVVYSATTVPKTTYYPSTLDRTQAKPIKLSQSGLVQKIDIKLLP